MASCTRLTFQIRPDIYLQCSSSAKSSTILSKGLMLDENIQEQNIIRNPNLIFEMVSIPSLKQIFPWLPSVRKMHLADLFMETRDQTAVHE